MRAPIDRIDSVLIAALAGATGADRAARLVAQVAEPESLAATVRRFVEVPVLTFGFDGGTVYVTVTDVVALGTATIVLVRFVAWLLSPLGHLFRRF